MSKLITLDGISQMARTFRNWVMTRMDENMDKVKFTPITYKVLKELRDNSQLVPGKQYRITDYVTTTTQTNTQSAGNQFDIIVTADDVNVLNENARAIQHTNDENDYFHNSNLAAWELKYSLDNDTSRFAWAGANKEYTIELPVSDNMRNSLEQWGAEIPDILICKWWDSPYNGPGPKGYGLDFYEAINVNLPDNDTFMIVYPCGSTPQSGVAFPEIIPDSYGNDSTGNVIYISGFSTECIIDTIPTVFETDNGKGVIYYMKDEFNNECPYDFKNIQFARWELSNPVGYTKNSSNQWVEDSNITETYGPLKVGFYGIANTDNVFTFGNNNFKIEYTISSEPTYCYTFGKRTDYSLKGISNTNLLCYNNVIKERHISTSNGRRLIFILNNIVFLETNCYNNTFGDNCNDNTFGESCNYNTFGNDCYYNTFGESCTSNTFGDSCTSNTFGNGCTSNIFGNDCTSNIFGFGCTHNTFGIYCTHNTFGIYCEYNTFGIYCNNNTFGKECHDNTFGNDCRYNTFGKNCIGNTFGNCCYNNTFGESCNYNTFGNDCHHISFRTSASKSGELKNYCHNNCFDDNVGYIVIYNVNESTVRNKFQNVHVKKGVVGTSTLYEFINILGLNSTNEISVYNTNNGVGIDYGPNEHRISGATTLTQAHKTIILQTNSSFTINLPSTPWIGADFTFIKLTGDANTISINGNGKTVFSVSTNNLTESTKGDLMSPGVSRVFWDPINSRWIRTYMG